MLTAGMLYYARATNQLFQLNDAGTAWSSSVARGTAISLSNSECPVNVGAATFDDVGDGLDPESASDFHFLL